MTREADEAVAEVLSAFGFRKRIQGIFTVDLEDQFMGWLGLNRATRHRAVGEVEINPVVGVRHQGIERIVADCREEKFHAYVPPTVSTPIGYVMPGQRYRAWVFGGHVPTSAVAKDLAGAVEEHGLPFMREAANLPGLIRQLRRNLGHHVRYRTPVALMLVGEVEHAREELRRELEAIGDRADLAAEEFQGFAAEFRRRYLEAVR